MTEGELVAESEREGNFRERVVGCPQECGGDIDASAPEITGEGFAHDRSKDLGKILFRVSEELRQYLEREPFMEIVADKLRDRFGNIFPVARRVARRRECDGQIEEVADHFHEFMLRFRACESSGPLRSLATEFGGQIS